jgi:hypothetical protein
MSDKRLLLNTENMTETATASYPAFTEVVEELIKSQDEETRMRNKFRADLAGVLQRIRYSQYTEEWTFEDRPYFFHFHRKTWKSLSLSVIIRSDHYETATLEMLQVIMATECKELKSMGYTVKQEYDHDNIGLTGITLALFN